MQKDDYTPIVARLEDVAPIPGADRIVSATARGLRVVVGAEHKVDELGVVFPATPNSGVLDQAFALHAGLLREHPVTGEKLGGYLDTVPRVKCLRIRQQPTDGLWLPLDLVVRAAQEAARGQCDIDVMQLVEGYELADGRFPTTTRLIGREGEPLAKGYKVARRYYPPTQQRREKRQRDQSPENRRLREYSDAVRAAMPEHYDTPALYRTAHRFPYGAVVFATEKVHGKSGMVGRRRLALGPVKRAVNRFASWFGRQPFVDTEVCTGTRRTVLAPDGRAMVNVRGGRGAIDHDFRIDIRDTIGPRLRPGEVVYFEVVGFDHYGVAIMRHRASGGGAEVKAIRAQFGEDIPYAYGCSPDGREWTPKGPSDVAVGDMSDAAVAVYRAPRYRVFAYRVTQDGVDLPFHRMRERALELGLEVPPLLGTWAHDKFDASGMSTEPSGYFRDAAADEIAARLQRLASKETMRRARELAEGPGGALLPSTLDAKTPREGVVLRVDVTSRDHLVAKYKAHPFGVLEGYAQDRGESDGESASEEDERT